MTQKNKKNQFAPMKSDFEDEPTPTHSRRLTAMGKTHRRIHPLGFRVVVRLFPDSNMTDGGLYLPEGAKQTMAESLLAEVIEVASAVDDGTEEEANVSGIPLGAKVLIPKTAGVKIPWDEELRIVETKEVLAIVDEMSIV